MKARVIEGNVGWLDMIACIIQTTHYISKYVNTLTMVITTMAMIREYLLVMI